MSYFHQCTAADGVGKMYMNSDTSQLFSKCPVQGLSERDIASV